MSIIDDLREREAEKGRDARTGLVLMHYWLLEMGRVPSDVIALRVSRCGSRQEVRRRIGESIEELEERANPSRSWRTLPWPIFEELDHILSAEEWEEALRLDAQLQEVAHEAAEAV